MNKYIYIHTLARKHRISRLEELSARPSLITSTFLHRFCSVAHATSLKMGLYFSPQKKEVQRVTTKTDQIFFTRSFFSLPRRSGYLWAKALLNAQGHGKALKTGPTCQIHNISFLIVRRSSRAGRNRKALMGCRRSNGARPADQGLLCGLLDNSKTNHTKIVEHERGL